MKYLAELVLEREHFDELAEECRRDGDFPQSWDAWLALQRQAHAEAVGSGLVLPPVSVEPAVFAAWCAEMEIVPCLDVLRAYALIQRQRAQAALEEDGRPKG